MAFQVPAAAQGMDNGTVDVYFQRITAAGKLEGCSLVFTTVTSDTAYLRGAQVLINGSLAMRLTNNTILYSGKLGTRDLAGVLSGQGKWSAPTHFHFSSRNGSTAASGKIAQSETEGYRLLIGPVDSQFQKFLGDLADSGEFTVGFNRKPDGQDVLAPVNLTTALKQDASGKAVRVTNPDTPREFFECVSQLAKASIDAKR